MHCPRCQHEECANPLKPASPTAQPGADPKSEVEAFKRASSEALGEWAMDDAQAGRLQRPLRAADPPFGRFGHDTHPRRGEFSGTRSAASGRRDPVTPPTSLDAAGRPRPTQAAGLWPRGRADALRAADLRPHGWVPPRTLRVPDWCGFATEYLGVRATDGSWQLVPIWEPDQNVNPLRRYAPPEPR